MVAVFFANLLPEGALPDTLIRLQPRLGAAAEGGVI